MKFEKFEKFCIENMVADWKDLFWAYLLAKYDGHIPDKVDLKAEWNIFISDATSKNGG